LLGRPNQIGRQHHELPGQTIGPDATDEIKGNAADDAGRKD
jgi:hypothetical protein